MVRHNALLRVFWPLEPGQPGAPGVLVGWRNSETDIIIAAILYDTEFRSVDNALKLGSLFRNSPHLIETILAKCGRAQFQALGVVNPNGHSSTYNGTSVVAWVHRHSPFPKIELPRGIDLDVQVIMFKRPNPSRMQYMSLQAIRLSLAGHLESRHMHASLDSVNNNEWLEKEHAHMLVEKLKLHTVVKFAPSRKDLGLPVIINQINCCYELNTLLQTNIALVRSRSRRTLSVSERVVESAADLWDYTHVGLTYVWMELVYPLFLDCFIRGLIAHRIVGEVILLIAGWRFVAFNASLRDISATAQQVDLRLQQFCYWPVQYMTLRTRKDDWQSITNNHTEYIRYYNSLWLVANDVIMGIALGSYIIENADAVASQVNALIGVWSITGLQRMITWLMDYPAGLKLNNELARFLGDLFLWVVEYWGNCAEMLRPSLPHIIRFIGFASFGGASMPLALCSDLTSLFTFHIHCFYVASARIYGWQLSIIVSLFHLFRGKKRNVLRNRIDSCDYELDQLLIGTILFTLLTFLLPTVAVFYFTCAFARSAIILLKAVLDAQLAALNHFPLFALMLRVKDAERLPGGILFELPDVPIVQMESISNCSSYIFMKSKPLSLRSIFHEYFEFGNRIRKHYLSPKVFLGFATGTFVPPLHRKNLYGLQYSMLPTKRVGIRDLWYKLKDSSKSAGKPVPSANAYAKKVQSSNVQRRLY